ncbi:MAG: diguanylate cyclase [Porcipelethomonas sp.]
MNTQFPSELSLKNIFPADMPEAEMYKNFLSSVPAGMGIFEVHDSGLKALFLNEYYYKTVGYTKEQYNFFLNDVTQTIFKSERDNFLLKISSVSEKNEVSCIVRTYRYNQSVCWLQIKAVKADIPARNKLILVSVSDISDQKAIEHSLSVKNERYRIFEETSQAVLFDYKVESDYMTFSYNLQNEIHHHEIPNYTNFMKTTPLVHPDHIPKFTNALREACQEVLKGTIEYKSLIIDPTQYLWCKTTYSSVADSEGHVTDIFGKIHNIDEEVKKRTNMIKKVEFDNLTQVYNKTAAFEKIEFALSQGYNDVYFVVIDIDNFKMFNDEHGHINGDEVLRITADLLRSYFPEAIAGRFGGDEFILFIKDYQKPDIVCEFESLKNNSYLTKRDGTKIRITYSIGIIRTDNPLSCTDLFIKADEVMYEAKRGGKDRIIFRND